MFEFALWLILVIQTDLGSGLTDHQRPRSTNQVKFDFANIRMAGSPDTTHGKGSCDTIFKDKGQSCEVIHLIVHIGLVKMSGRRGKDFFERRTTKCMYISKRINTFDLKFPHGFYAQTPV